MVMFVSPEQPLNAPLLIDWIELPIITLVSSEQLANPPSPIDVTSSFNVNKTVCSPSVSKVYDNTTPDCSTPSIDIDVKDDGLFKMRVADSVEVTLYLHNILDPVNGLI
jgi:hypothetical protein